MRKGEERERSRVDDALVFLVSTIVFVTVEFFAHLWIFFFLPLQFSCYIPFKLGHDIFLSGLTGSLFSTKG